MRKQSENKTDTVQVTAEDILRGSAHALTIFKPKAIQALAIFAKQGKPYLKCY